eukprot:scaffold109_cov252-Pinguiococcus_pyrenoidosus.AAC.39
MQRFLCLALSLIAQISAVDRSKFRSCAQTGFCVRLRNPEADAETAKLVADSVKTGDGFLTARFDDERLALRVEQYMSGVARIRIHDPAEPRWEPQEVIQEPPSFPKGAVSVNADSAVLAIDDETTLEVQYDPFVLSLRRGDGVAMQVNPRQYLRYEARGTQRAEKGGEELEMSSAEEEEDRHGGKKVVDYGEDGLAIYEDGTKEAKRELQEDAAVDEKFGGHTDHQKYGASAVGVDILFNDATDVYGIPEHASSLSLKTTTGKDAQYSDPYRLYTLDVFEYELDNPMALYGAIPFMMSLKAGMSESVGVFWHNPSETFVDIEDADGGKHTHWMSETGNFDLFLLSGPSPKSVMAQYAHVTGPTYLPPMFSLGFHQCRWNYKDEQDVAQVHQGFEDNDFPVDVIWLDIEHTDQKKYFTWDKTLFPNPVEMQKGLAAKGRKMVTIVDPHIKRDSSYYVHNEATSKGYYIKDEGGEKDYDGWCWSGSSSYPDFTCADVRQWWAEQFALNKYQGSTLDLFTWNDMNEPSVFNGPEVTMQKTKLNREGVESREWHNVYGLYLHMATSRGLTLRSPQKDQRPFVLSRAFYGGSQKYGAIWTGDNMAQWSHLEAAAPMLLSISMAGLGFVGADVGGFMGDPDAELMTRWMQAAAYQPFFRSHAHHDSRRREVWLFGEPWLGYMRKVTLERYTFLPYLYTLFAEAELMLGVSAIMRPLLLEFPEDPAVAKIDDAWMLGPALLVKPVVHQGAKSIDVYLPGSGPWYDSRTFKAVQPGLISSILHRGKGKDDGSAGFTTSVSADMDKIPVFFRGGHVIPRFVLVYEDDTVARS